MKRGKRLYTYVSRSATALNAVFSLIIFIYLFNILTTTTMFLYHVIVYFLRPSPVLEFVRSVIFFNLFNNFGALTFILFTAETHVQKVRTLAYSQNFIDDAPSYDLGESSAKRTHQTVDKGQRCCGPVWARDIHDFPLRERDSNVGGGSVLCGTTFIGQCK